MTLLRLSGVSRRFGGVVAVDGVDLVVETGEIVGLMGRTALARRRYSA